MRFTCATATALIVLGVLVMAGWVLEVDALKTVLPGLVSMKANTALCFILSGVAIVAMSRTTAGGARIARSAAIVVLAIALATLLQDLFGVDFGIDQAIVFDSAAVPHPGRMATATALGFAVTGAALIVMAARASSGGANSAVVVSSFFVIALGLLGVIGYALNFQALYAWHAFNTMALHTAAGFALLGTALWCAGNRLPRVSTEDQHITSLALGLVVAATTTTAVISLAAAEDGVATTLAAGMKATLEARAAQVGAGIELRTRTAASITNVPAMLRALQRLAEDPSREDDRRTVEEALASYRPQGFEWLVVRSAQGDEIASVGAPVETPGMQQSLETATGAVLVWRDGMYLRNTLPLGGPLGLLGTLITEQFLPVTTTGLLKGGRYVGETAELLLCSAGPKGHDCFPSHLTREPFTLPPDSNGLRSLLEQAPGGQPAFGAAIDQRGRRVLAAAVPVGTYGPMAILKVDADEIYRPIGIQIQFTMALILAISIAGYLLMRRLLRPLAVNQERRVRARTAELERANAELVESEQRFRLALESAPNGNLLVADDGRILFANARAKELLGYDVEELTRMQVEQLMPEPLRGAHIVHRAAFAADPRSRPMGLGRELYALRKDRTRLPVEIGLGPVRIGAKTIVLASIVDITERKRAEDELRRSNEALERSNIELQRFAYVASHDLQTPLRSIAGFAQLLQSEYVGRLDPQADDWIRRTVESSKDMQTLVRELLEYSRVDSQASTFGPVPMQQIVDGAVMLLDATIRETGATVTHAELPVVTGDRSQLSQLMLNLIGNAIKYRSDAPPRVHVAAQRREGEWMFSVCDNGIGIEAKHRDRIFEMFRRLHDQKEIPGSGIGLAVCRRVVHRHGGRIWVESEPGQGSTFFFTIPERIGQAS